MLRVGIKLTLIFVLVYSGVTIWYGRLEDSLNHASVIRRAFVERDLDKTSEGLRKAIDYTIIVDRNIFQAVGQAGGGQDKNPAPTKLKLTLMGTVSGTQRDARAVIIDEQQKKQDIYKIGDSIQGALIKSIQRGKVILRVNGRSEALLIKDRHGGTPDVEPRAFERRVSVHRKSLRQRLTGRAPVVRPRYRTSYRLPQSEPPEQNSLEYLDQNGHVSPDSDVIPIE